MKKTLGLISLIVSGSALAAPTTEELQQQINELRAQIEATATAVENQQLSGSSVSIGGYGEMHINRTLEEGQDDSIDFHRYVLFIGKQLDKKTRFFSEFELEHSLSGDGKEGEVELEQAFIEHQFTDNLSAKAGLFLIPVGILNETHEPDTFYGVERNSVEKNIIPTTWWEGGAGFTGKFGKVVVDVAATSGLNIDVASEKYKIRDGRQKVSKAKANKLAYTARVNYSALPGVTIGAAYQYQEDVTQGLLGIDAQLIEAHAVIEKSGFALRALYAQWILNDKIEDTSAAAAGADKQDGYYVEPSYRINNKVGVFARFSKWDNNAGTNGGIDGVNDSETLQYDYGVNYWIAETAVLKADFQQIEDADANTSDIINLGVGYSF